MATTGTVKFFNASKGFGFITPTDGGNDAVAHIRAVGRAGMTTLHENQGVSSALEPSRNGKMSACNLQSGD